LKRAPARRRAVPGRALRPGRADRCSGRLARRAACLLGFLPALSALAADGGTQALDFRHDDGVSIAQLLLALGFVAILAAAGWWLVRYLRQAGLVQPVVGRTASSAVRVLQLKRVSPRLSIVTVSIDDRRTVVFADNGQSLLLLSDGPADHSGVSPGGPA